MKPIALPIFSIVEEYLGLQANYCTQRSNIYFNRSPEPFFPFPFEIDLPIFWHKSLIDLFKGKCVVKFENKYLDKARVRFFLPSSRSLQVKCWNLCSNIESESKHRKARFEKSDVKRYLCRLTQIIIVAILFVTYLYQCGMNSGER